MTGSCTLYKLSNTGLPFPSGQKAFYDDRVLNREDFEVAAAANGTSNTTTTTTTTTSAAPATTTTIASAPTGVFDPIPEMQSRNFDLIVLRVANCHVFFLKIYCHCHCHAFKAYMSRGLRSSSPLEPQRPQKFATSEPPRPWPNFWLPVADCKPMRGSAEKWGYGAFFGGVPRAV